MPMQQAMSRIADSERRAVMSWLTRAGPFWDDLRQHGANDWLACGDELVTDTAVGEAAFRSLHGVACGLVSVTPSDWEFSPVEVAWCFRDGGLTDQHASLENWVEVDELQRKLQGTAPPLSSWDDVREACSARFENLIFGTDCFEPMRGHPFSSAAANRLFALLDVLDRLCRAFDATGNRTLDGHRIYSDFFTGNMAPFSDSSDSERNRFASEMTFPDPRDPDSRLFCPWHGKVRRTTLRFHFSWPIRFGEPVYVVYAGPKITKR
ncbi:MAG: hypothetical protein OXB98_03625 [Bryobacterales bacterium]|nr:hypothetical protein [Bryobacterales bacterium]